MATSWNDSVAARRWRILIGYNLPLALWTAFALLSPALGFGLRWECPVRALIGWCPGCGLTEAYSRLLRGQWPPDPWLGVVVAGFAANAIWSVVRAVRVSKH